MPELPEVETTRRGLSSIIGQKIGRITVNNRSFRIPIEPKFEELCEKSEVISLKRRSKYLFMQMDNGKTAIIHLGMSGRMKLEKSNAKTEKHDHIIWHFSDKKLSFNDTRRFGLVVLCETDELSEHKLIKNLGPEPLEKQFTADYLINTLKNKSGAIKNAIMDAKVVVGVGNIYASESLFRAGIHPAMPANKVSAKNLAVLVKEIKSTLEEAIEAGGSSLKDYAQSNGELGYFQHTFKVYGRNGENCEKCETLIEKITLGQRSSFYCPACQPLS